MNIQEKRKAVRGQVASRADAFRLFMQGTLALAQVEANGIRIDEPYLDEQIVQLGQQILTLEEKLKKDEVYARWQRRFGDKTKLTSSLQLGEVLVKDLEIHGLGATATGRTRTDVSALEGVKNPFVQGWLQLGKLRKVKSTFLEGIKKETVAGYCHPFFHLASGGNDDKGGAKSFRSSASDPNAQNFPGRDEKMGRIVRSCFIARDGHQLAEVDFKGIEVAIAGCYCQDPEWIKYLNDKSLDMHWDMAKRLYFLEGPKHKKARYVAKNRFVFPQFYGSYYLDCARALWEALDREKLLLEDGTSFKKHLRKHGIRELGTCDEKLPPRPGTFEKHVQDVERWYWDEKFPVFRDWKVKWHQDYLATGGFDYYTGFRVEGYLKRNAVLNYAIQGSAFHCLLWTLIRLQKWLVKHKLKTRIVSQVHDSLLLDAHRRELQEVLDRVVHIVQVELRRHFPWIVVPLDVECEAAPVGGSWFDKKPWTRATGKWALEED